MTAPECVPIDSFLPLSLKYDNDKTVSANAAASAGTENGVSDAKLMLLGFIPVKNVSVEIEPRRYVIVGGEPFGIRIYTDGLVVSSVSSVRTNNGSVCPADNAGIEKGDIILRANGVKLTTNEQLVGIIRSAGNSGEGVGLEVKRDGRIFNTTLSPVFDTSDGTMRAGLHIRDSIAGIGTLTYIDPADNSFFGLGHGICDSSSGRLMPLLEGDIVRTEITSVTKSMSGSPGSLIGRFEGGEVTGILEANTSDGVYGTILTDITDRETVPVALRHEAVRGPAVMLTTVDGSVPKEYGIEIEEISYNGSSDNRNMVIRITDSRLLKDTGGIVQGMSGSPIIQNGRLIGAVTHVFVNDPTRGYAASVG